MSRNKNQLAKQLRQNWVTRFPDERGSAHRDCNDELTNLSWLQNSNLMAMNVNSSARLMSTPEMSTFESMFTQPGAAGSASEAFQRSFSVDSSLLQDVANHRFETPELTPAPHAFAFLDEATTSNFTREDYRNDPNCRPPYSYATLICLSMRELQRSKITLSDIYKWIMENFCYYRYADPSWQNLVRHSLTLNKCFQKVKRRKDEAGKGGFWRINPEYRNLVENAGSEFVSLPRKLNNNGTIIGRRKVSDALLPDLGKRHRLDRLKSSNSCSNIPLPSMSSASQWLGFRQGSGFGSEFTTFFDEDKTRLNATEDESDTALSHLLSSDLNSGFNCLSRSKDRCMLEASLHNCMPSPCSDGAIEDYLNTESDAFSLLDSNGQQLDLTVHGQGVIAPSWWDRQAAAEAHALSLSNSFGYRHFPSPLLPDEDQEWVDAQLNLEGLDSILGLGLDTQIPTQ